jgi:hypothetical protein
MFFGYFCFLVVQHGQVDCGSSWLEFSAVQDWQSDNLGCISELWWHLTCSDALFVAQMPWASLLSWFPTLILQKFGM